MILVHHRASLVKTSGADGNLDTSIVKRSAFHYSKYDTKVVLIFPITFITVGDDT